jgi:hypothetical protein
MFSNIGIPGLILILVILVILLSIPLAIVLLIVNFKKRNIRLKRIEEKLDKTLSDKGN